MALQKPVINPIPAFDADFSQDITFSVSGGDQVTSNRIIIKLGSTNTIIYDDTTTSFELAHSIPAHTLTNGNYYVVQVQTFNVSEEASVLSSPLTFYCYSNPTFIFSNLPTGNVLKNAEYTFWLMYNQEERENLNSWEINVYNSSKELLWTSGINYSGASGAPPSNFSFSVSGFEDSNIYYIRALGQTEQFTELDTDYITLTTVFDSPSIYTQVSLINNADEGYILINSNVISLDGTTNPDPPIYIDNQEIDLRQDESYVNWENSFAIYDISTVRIWYKNANPNSIIATFYNSNNVNQVINIYEREYEESGTTYIYIEMYYNGADGTTGYIYSNTIEKATPEQQYMVWLQKSSGLYDLRLAEVTT